MKTLWIGILGSLLLGGLSLAQQTAARPNQNSPAVQSDKSNSAQPSVAPRIAPGSVIPVQLTKTIDAKKVKTGDEVEAKVTQDLKANNGEVIVPKNTKVMGHVTEAQAHNKEQKESQVGIAFDHAIMKNGNDLALPMSIQAIIAPAALNSGSNNNNDTQPPSAGPGGMSPSYNSGRPGAMGSGMSAQTPNPPAAGSQWPTDTKTGTNQPITGNTQGVVGISNLQLSAAANKAEGSVVSSEKSNVKLDSGTLMLLRVNP